MPTGELEIAAARRRQQRARRQAPARRPAREEGARRLVWAALVLAAVTFLWALFQPFAAEGGDEVRVVIPKQASVGEIADRLDDAGVIASAALFQIRATLSGRRGDLRAGAYTLRKASPYGKVIDTLSKGPAGAPVIEITIPEGLDRVRIARLARQAGIAGDYMKASADPSQFNLRRYGAQRARTLEGFLFPATYELKQGASAETLVRKQLEGFRLNFATVNMRYARRRNLTPYDVVNIASMIEGEASLDRERPLVAAVIYNRLRAGIPLGIDATTRFETRNYNEPLTASTLAKDTPYNTRLSPGLPPGPIGNPGLASLKAAARPAAVDYLYYVAKPGTCGEHAFSSTDAEFQRDVAAYNSAREAAGGRDPQKCP
jgi:UPF0755 protein